MASSGHWRLVVRVTVTMLAAARVGAPAAQPGPAKPAAAVRPGIEVLLQDSAALVRGKGVGLVSNQGGVDAAGVSDVERLLRAGVEVLLQDSAALVRGK